MAKSQETMFMGVPEDAQAMARFVIDAFLKTPDPQRINFFFPVSGPNNAWAKWQAEFMTTLVRKNAIKLVGDRFVKNNRFFLENLLKDGDKLVGIVMDAAGVKFENPKVKPPAAVEETEVEMEERPQEKPQDSSETVALLEKLQELMVRSLEIQAALAENIIHVRDRFEMRQTKLVERVKGIDTRLEAIEQKLDIPRQDASTIAHEDIEAIAEIVSNTVNSMNEAVGSIKDEVRSMASSVNKASTDRIAQVQASIARINNEFTALQQLTLESLSEIPR